MQDDYDVLEGIGFVVRRSDEAIPRQNQSAFVFLFVPPFPG